jgi:hypothetical protein
LKTGEKYKKPHHEIIWNPLYLGIDEYGSLGCSGFFERNTSNLSRNSHHQIIFRDESPTGFARGIAPFRSSRW